MPLEVNCGTKETIWIDSVLYSPKYVMYLKVQFPLHRKLHVVSVTNTKKLLLFRE
jgi:hypothetical protein